MIEIKYAERYNPCSRFLKKTAGSQRLIRKPLVRIGFSFYAFSFTDFPIISLENLIRVLIFIKKKVCNVSKPVF